MDVTCSAACWTSCTTTPPRIRTSTRRCLHAAYRGLVELCSEGISDSTGQYFHLEQIEALGQVRDLSQTLTSCASSSASVRSCGEQAAHDLRGNFGVVANAAAGLTLQAVPVPMREKFFRLLQNSVSSVHTMLDDVMTLARLQAGQEQRRLGSSTRRRCFARCAKRSRGRRATGGCSCVAEGAERLDVIGDPVKIRRIVQNLILNAIKYTQSGGVTVSWGDSRAGDAERWMLTVRDTGPGIHAGPGAPIAEALEEATLEASQLEQRESGADASIPPSARTAGEVRCAARRTRSTVKESDCRS